MGTLTQKRFYRLSAPTELDKKADMDRLGDAMADEFGTVKMPYAVLARDFMAFRQGDFAVTATVAELDGAWTLLGVEPGDRADCHYGLACDLGSTTLFVNLVDLNSGEVVAAKTCPNPQIKRGADILSRIFYTQEPAVAAERRRELRELVVGGIDELIAAVLAERQVEAADCRLMVVSGNTTMIHFLLGIDAFCVFSTPFAPHFNRAPIVSSAELGFRWSGTLWCFPSIANYLGGDTVSGLCAVELMERDEIGLFMDIGTNGEMAIGSKEFLIGGAGAAGPALEGDISRYGMRADSGAIDRIRIEDGALTFTTIDNAKPRGICGSGIVDLLAQMLEAGWMNILGNLVPEASDRVIAVTGDNGETEWAVAYALPGERPPGGAEGAEETLIFTQADINAFSETKAAAATMASCLLEAADMKAEELDRVYLAGAFGKHVDVDSAIAIGLYPDLPKEKFILVGNTSLLGCVKVLLDATLLRRAEEIVATLYYLEFAMQPNFLDLMLSLRFYPKPQRKQE